ncbi:DUF2599 domain-containing protein [Pseudomonas sp. FEN]|uniref:DUF2599 domain-containing protein n=1 Tax=Pseudomonas sp. FEN TaxID=2767468 RepID=UPI00174A12EC|nr:DUF2599 domain-containing protein [Pseudomonas sp. FEN]CAD5200799.1 hypothetical protein [Pseudomonas sp. FEN]
MRTYIFVLLFVIRISYALDLSPNAIGGQGNIPARDSVINFSLADGDFSSNLSLPDAAPDATRITINSNATYKSVLSLKNTDVGVDAISVEKKDSFSFVYSASRQKWRVQTVSYSPNSQGSTIPDLSGQKIIRYSVADGNWAAAVTLPNSAPDGSVVLFDSTATYSSQISPVNTSTGKLEVKTGERYSLVYRADLKSWSALRRDANDSPVAGDTGVCTQYIESASWIQRYDPGTQKNEWSLSVIPTTCGRAIQSDQTNAEYAELVRKFGNDWQWKNNDGGGMRRQLVCHLTIARDKTPWNLEPYRPDVTHDVSISSGCNPH